MHYVQCLDMLDLFVSFKKEQVRLFFDFNKEL